MPHSPRRLNVFRPGFLGARGPHSQHTHRAGVVCVWVQRESLVSRSKARPVCMCRPGESVDDGHLPPRWKFWVARSLLWKSAHCREIGAMLDESPYDRQCLETSSSRCKRWGVSGLLKVGCPSHVCYEGLPWPSRSLISRSFVRLGLGIERYSVVSAACVSAQPVFGVPCPDLSDRAGTSKIGFVVSFNFERRPTILGRT